MLLAIDVGNTNTVLGVFQRNALKKILRFSTTHYRTADEWALVLDRALPKTRSERTACVASVVPPVEPLIQQALEGLGFGAILTVRAGLKTGIASTTTSARGGADRVVDAVALKEMYGLPGIVVDFGTATTFDVVSAKGEYLGASSPRASRWGRNRFSTNGAPPAGGDQTTSGAHRQRTPSTACRPASSTATWGSRKASCAARWTGMGRSPSSSQRADWRPC